MNLVWQRASGGSMSSEDLRVGARTVSHAAKLLTLFGLAGGLYWIVWVYGNGIRDPRYLDGWILAAGFGLQLGFHIASKSGRLSSRWAIRWRALHIYIGYLLIAAFVSHSDFSWPDTGFEWILWAGFTLVTLSGAFGTYLSWRLKTSGRIEPGLTFDRIPARREEISRQVHTIATDKAQTELALALPGLPHDDWIADLYAQKLRNFFETSRNTLLHPFGSQAALKKLTHEIDELSRYVDKQGQDKLVTIKRLAIEKDRLEFARIYLWLSKAWLFVHVPITYALVVLTVFHVVVVYAYSSGAW